MWHVVALGGDLLFGGLFSNRSSLLGLLGGDAGELRDDEVTEQVRMAEEVFAERTRCVGDTVFDALAAKPEADAHTLFGERVTITHADDREGHLVVHELLHHHAVRVAAREVEPAEGVGGELHKRLQRLRVMDRLHNLPIESRQRRLRRFGRKLGFFHSTGARCQNEVDLLSEVFAEEVQHVGLDVTTPPLDEVDLFRWAREPRQGDERVLVSEDAEDVT